jgi:undecaprenyl-diphosphatase
VSVDDTSLDRARPFDRGVDAAAEVIRLGIRPFAAPRGQPRTRRATDVVALVPAVIVLAYLVAVYPPSALELSLVRAAEAFPRWLDPIWSLLQYLVALWAAAVVVAALVARRFLIVAQALLALVIAVALSIVCARLAADDWPDLVDTLLADKRAPDFPGTILAASVAVIGTVSPHLVRPLGRIGRWLVVLGGIGTAISSASTPGGTLAALMVGVIAAAIVNLVLGTSAGRPGLSDVAAGLAQLGVHAEALVQEERQVAGVLRVGARGADGRALLVKVYGRDAADNQLVQRLWRAAWYRTGGPAIGTSRLHAAEHEAFVTLLVRQSGLPTRDVVTAGETAGGNALLVLAGDAVPLSALAPADVDDALLRRCWVCLRNLGALRVAHQQLSPETVVLLDGGVGLAELGGATVAPRPHQLEVDRAQLLATTAAVAGAERATAVAVGSIGPEAVGALLPYLPEPAFAPPLRRSLEAAGIAVDDLRESTAAAVELESP